MFSFQTKSFGLDIGDRSIKIAAVKYVKDWRGKEMLILVSLGEKQIPAGLIVNGEIKNPPAVVKIIRDGIKDIKGSRLETNAVTASLPENLCYLKIINAPKNLENNQAARFAEDALAQYFPLEKSELYFDWQVISPGRVAIGVAPRNIVDSYTYLLEQADLLPTALEIESIAIVRALTPNPGTETEYKIIIDLGATRSSIIAVYQNNPVLTLNVPLSGEMMTLEIAKANKTTPEEAEKLKIICGLDIKKCPPKIKKTILSIISSSTSQIKTGLGYLHKFLKHRTDKIYICGGVAAMSKLGSILSEKLHVKVRHADPSPKIILNKKLNLSADDLSKYVTAIGLALRDAGGTAKNAAPKTYLKL